MSYLQKQNSTARPPLTPTNYCCGSYSRTRVKNSIKKAASDPNRKALNDIQEVLREYMPMLRLAEAEEREPTIEDVFCAVGLLGPSKSRDHLTDEYKDSRTVKTFLKQVCQLPTDSKGCFHGGDRNGHLKCQCVDQVHLDLDMKGRLSCTTLRSFCKGVVMRSERALSGSLVMTPFFASDEDARSRHCGCEIRNATRFPASWAWSRASAGISGGNPKFSAV